jgi:chemotaxis protein CheC
MYLDTETLSTLYEMARQGSGLAADRLTAMTGIESRVTATRIEFPSPRELGDELAGTNLDSGTLVTLEGGLSGRTALVFDSDEFESIAQSLVADVTPETATRDQLVKSAVPELCAIVNNGFVDGWANVLGVDVEVSTPWRVSDVTPEQLLEDEEEVTIRFRSHIETYDTELAFEHYFAPEQETTRSLASARSGIEYEKLAGFDEVAQRGAERGAEDLSQLTGTETDIQVHTVSFIALDAIPGAVPNERVASVAFGFEGTPSGYLLFLFDEMSARNLAGRMVGNEPAEGLGEMGRDALQEASNIMASGLLDGWANALETTIEHTTPAFTWELGPAAVDPLVASLSEDRAFAFVFDSEITAADDRFDVDIYVIPDEADIEAAIDAADPERMAQASTRADTTVLNAEEADSEGHSR